MTTKRQLDEEAIFHLARKLGEPADREEYLNQICADDENLRQRVEALLAVHEQDRKFLKSAPQPAPTTDQPAITEAPGQTIGRYKLLQKIGEGGFGVVFMAQQQRPVRRQVALKIIKPGMDTHAVVARFEAERQALAIMDHPNIARVLDGGATESGRPYFVMELVKGAPITEYCDKNELSTVERLELFMVVCQAVQHAHQKGIIHRDLKPSNVLVTLADGQPIVKVIDFGVAKAMNQQLTEKTLFTAFGQMVGTPQYMSPEQAEMSCLDADTRSDVYSLGVLLYELLTGTTPLESERLRTAGYAEIQRLIREEEPPKPSTRLTTSGKELTIIAKQRSATPEKLKSLVRGDLDWIVMKALEKDRNRRYETPSSLADDVERMLNHQPIEACPPSLGYRLRKFVRRNRTLIGAMSVVAFALIAATSISLWFAWESSQKEKEAAEQRDAAKAALDKLQLVLIERGVLQAMACDSEFETTLQLCRDAKISLDWLLTLEGCAKLHIGEAAVARNLLKKAVQENPANPSAAALLLIAFVWNGDWESWSLNVESVEKMKPREEYADYDRLFLAYAHFYVDHRETAQRLQRLLRDKPMWLAPRGIMASAWAHAAAVHERADYALKAVDEFKAPRMMLSKNPLVLTLGVANYIGAGEVWGPSEDLVSQTDEDARLLGNYPQYTVATLIRALYFQSRAKHVKELEVEEYAAWNDLLKHGSGYFLEEAMAAFFRVGNESQALKVAQMNSTEAKTARAYILAQSDKLSNRVSAYEIYRKLNKKHNSLYVRYKLLQLLLLLEKEPEAQHACRDWLGDSRGAEHFGNWERRSIEYIARGAPEDDDIFTASEGDHVGAFFVNYQKAFVAMARRKPHVAMKHFKMCVGWGYADERRQWALAFASRLSRRLQTNETVEAETR